MSNRHGLRRLLGLLLILMMACVLLPAAVFAEEGAEQPAVPAEPAAPAVPAAPTDEEVSSLLAGSVTVRCTRGHSGKQSDLLPGTYIIGAVAGDAESGYTCTVTINDPDAYVSDYSTATGETHTRFSVTPDSAAVTLKYDNGAWTLPGGSGITVAVSCSTPPAAPTEAEVEELLRNVRIEVRCNSCPNWSKNNLWEGEYKIGGVTEENGTYRCTVALDAASYAERSPLFAIIPHKLYGDPKPTFELVYRQETWKLDSSSIVTITATCASTVTYTDGVEGEEIFADQVTGGVRYGSATPAFAGPPTRAGYTFDGWDPVVSETVTENVTYTAKWKPTNQTVRDLMGERILVRCENWMTHSFSTFLLKDNTYTVGSVSYDADRGYICKVTITDPAPYVDFFCKERPDATHTVPAGQVWEITLVYNGSTWTFPDSFATFILNCAIPAPDEATVEGLLKNAVIVRCDNPDVSHQAETFDLANGKYDIGSTQNGNTVTCTVTVHPDDYVSAYARKTGKPHTLVSPGDLTIRLKYYYLSDGSCGWHVAKDAAPVTFPVACETYTVTYTDGVDGEELFADQTHKGLYAGDTTPAFAGTPKRTGYVFDGWSPEVGRTVTASVTYTALWEADANGNGIADRDEEKYTVTYTDGAKGRAFADQVYDGLLSGTDTPEFNGTPRRAGYTFAGWTPKINKTVTGSVTYTAAWKAVSTTGKDKVPKTGDGEVLRTLGGVLLLSFCGAGAAWVIDRRRKQS